MGTMKYEQKMKALMGGGVLRLEMLRKTGVDGTKFDAMRYKGWAGGQNWRI